MLPKLHFKSKIYGLCRHRANNIEINRNMGQNVFNFQDNTELLYSKWSSGRKQPLFVKECFQIWPFRMVHYRTKCWILKITNGLHVINTVKIQVKKYNPNMNLESDPDLELTHTHNELRWDISGTGVRARVHCKFRSKSTTQTWIWSWIRIQSWHPPNLARIRHRWDQTHDRTLNSGQKVQPKYGSGAASLCGDDHPHHYQLRWDTTTHHYWLQWDINGGKSQFWSRL